MPAYPVTPRINVNAALILTDAGEAVSAYRSTAAYAVLGVEGTLLRFDGSVEEIQVALTSEEVRILRDRLDAILGEKRYTAPF